MKNWLVLLLFSSLLTTGCQANNDEEAGYDLRRDTTNPNYMSIRAGNVNLGDHNIHNLRYMDLRGTGDFGQDDRDLAKAIVNRTGDFTAEKVSIRDTTNVRQMVITVKSRGGLNREEKLNRIAQLHESLVRSLPGYAIEIRER